MCRYSNSSIQNKTVICSFVLEFKRTKIKVSASTFRLSKLLCIKINRNIIVSSKSHLYDRICILDPYIPVKAGTLVRFPPEAGSVSMVLFNNFAWTKHSFCGKYDIFLKRRENYTKKIFCHLKSGIASKRSHLHQ